MAMAEAKDKASSFFFFVTSFFFLIWKIKSVEKREAELTASVIRRKMITGFAGTFTG